MSHTVANKTRLILMWLSLAFILSLAGLSIFAAFLGADRAQAFFSSLPLGFYWFCFVIILIAAISTFPRLLKKPFLLMMHLGPALVILGALWGSPQAHMLRQRLFNSTVIPRGYMIIPQGQSTTNILSEQETIIGTLPFNVTLNQFRREFYEPGILSITSPTGQTRSVSANLGQTIQLTADGTTLTINRRFDNLRVIQQGPLSAVIDQPESGDNAALELLIQSPTITDQTLYVYADQPPQHQHHLPNWQFTYARQIRDYISELSVTDNQGQTLHTCNIEVNYPMSFGGYSFYQHSWSKLAGNPVTVLAVVSETGHTTVFLGYWLLAIGIAGHFAVRLYRLRTKQKNGC